MNTKKRDEEYVAHTYGRYDLEFQLSLAIVTTDHARRVCGVDRILDHGHIVDPAFLVACGCHDDRVGSVGEIVKTVASSKKAYILL